MQNNAARFWESKMGRYKRFVVKAAVVKSKVYSSRFSNSLNSFELKFSIHG